MRVLVLGATGYIGSRLVPHLLEHGYDVVAASSSPPRPERFGWDDRVRAIRCDVTDPAAVAEAIEDVDAVVYLVHSLDRSDFSDRDRVAAETVAAAVAESGVRRLVYLSGLVPQVPEADLSAHIASRLEVERILLGATDGAVALRAGVVIGAGSTSFEIIRQIATLFLVQPVPTWMRSAVQPVAASDVLRAITDGLADDGPTGAVDLGAPDVVAYADLLHVVRRRGRAVPRPRTRAGRPHRAGRPRRSARDHGAVPHRHRAHRVAAPRHGLPAGPHVGAALGRSAPRPRGGGAAGAHPDRTPAPRARCPPTRPGPGRCRGWTSYPSPPPGRRPPGSPSTASARSSRTSDGRHLRTWRSWTGPGAVHGVLGYRRLVASGVIGPGARRLGPCPSR